MLAAQLVSAAELRSSVVTSHLVHLSFVLSCVSAHGQEHMAQLVCAVQKLQSLQLQGMHAEL